MHLSPQIAFIGYKSKTDSLRVCAGNRSLRLTPTWRGLAIPLVSLFVLGPIQTAAIVIAWKTGLLDPFPQLPIIPCYPWLLFVLFLDVVFVYQLTRRRAIEVDAPAREMRFMAVDWGRTQRRAILLSDVKSIDIRGLDRLAFEDGTTIEANRIPSLIVSVELNDRSAIRMFETTSHAAVDAFCEWMRANTDVVINAPNRADSKKSAAEVARDAIFG
jgi:hypothetical protein